MKQVVVGQVVRFKNEIGDAAWCDASFGKGHEGNVATVVCVESFEGLCFFKISWSGWWLSCEWIQDSEFANEED